MTVLMLRIQIHAHTSRSSPTQPVCGSDHIPPIPLHATRSPLPANRTPLTYTNANSYKDTCTSNPSLLRKRVLGRTTASVNDPKQVVPSGQSWFTIGFPSSQSLPDTTHCDTIHQSLNISLPIRYHRETQLSTSRFQDTCSHSKHWTTGLKPLGKHKYRTRSKSSCGDERSQTIWTFFPPTDCYSFKAIFLQLYKCSFWN